MARRKYFGRKKSYSKKGSSVNATKIAITGLAYGAFRNKIQDMIPNLGVPYSDSLLLGAAGYYMAKKSGWMKHAGIAILAIEAGAIGNTFTSSNTSSTMLEY